jgi:excisionase family DNA binding protein
VSERLAEGDLLTVAQARRFLPVAPSTIYRLVETGRLPAHRIKTTEGGRGRLLIHRADLVAFVAKTRETRPREPTAVDVDGLLEKVRGKCS